MSIMLTLMKSGNNIDTTKLGISQHKAINESAVLQLIFALI